MLVYGQEWSLWLSRHSVPAGRVVVQLWNRGQDPHNLAIRSESPRFPALSASDSAPLTPAGKLTTVTWRLRPGTYLLYCSLPGHAARGMRTRLVVR